MARQLPKQGRERRRWWARPLRWWHTLAFASGVLCAPFGFAGNQKEEALADGVRVALSNAIMDARPPKSVLLTPTDRAQYDQWLADAMAGRTPAPSEEPTGETIELAAANIAFDKKELSVAADTAWTLRLTNQDTVVHNVVILDGDSNEVFRSGDVTGPDGSGDFAVPPLPAGEYTFYCEYHPVPDMTGTLTVQ